MASRIGWSWLVLGLVLWAGRAEAQVQVKPWFLVIVDTSGSMYDASGGGNACTNGATNEPTCTCTGCSNTNSCGWARNRISDAKCALRNILNSTGDAEFALMQFRHNCSTTCASQGGGDSATCDADLLVPISPSNYTPLEWVDNSCQSNCTGGNRTRELYAYGNTPLGQSLVRAKEYFTSSVNGFSSPTAADAYTGCRPISVILLTDGMENCGGNASTAATSLRTSVVPSPTGNKTIAIKTYVVGFGLTAGDTNIEAIATAGATDAPGTYKGFYAQDEEELSAALNQIIVDSQLNERCDGVDNDCDTRIDEDNPKYCDFYGIRTANPMVPSLANPSVLVAQNTQDTRLAACSGMVCPVVNGDQGDTRCSAPEYAQSSQCSPANILCTSPGERCNGNDDDCDGKSDEGAPAIAESNEVCGDNKDNDCDSNIDEDCNGCISQPEVCDNLDNDCDGVKDDGVTQSCGTDVGECVAGTQTCAAGVWGTCSGTGPVAETCNNKDDDCDGVIDGFTVPCGTSTVGLCREGARTCVAGVLGACVGNVEPATEVCDGLDNDCSGLPDNDGVSDTRVGQACGKLLGECDPGTTICSGGDIVCQGGTNGSAELCNGLDDDCDGRTDEGVAATDISVGQPCIAPGGVVMVGPVSVVGECKVGNSVCIDGALACSGYVGPSMELCDALDQDCDGDPVNDVDMTDPRVGQACGNGLGECIPGERECVGTALQCVGGTGPGTETCNGDDDDCDGLIDENLPAVPTACDNGNHGNVGACKVGQEACIAGVIACQGEVTPTAEICDGVDNNCNGSVDEGNPEGGGTCGVNTGLCSTGTFVCTGGTLECPDDVEPVQELCDGEDNDCDGLTDEDNPGGGTPCGDDEDGDDLVGTCRTSLDPTNPSLPLDQPCGECRFGITVCQGGDFVCLGTVGKSDEVCDGLDNDCDSACVLDLDDPANPVYKCPTARCALPNSDPNFAHCLDHIDEGVGGPGPITGSDPNIGVMCSGGGACSSGYVECVDGVPTCVGGEVPETEVCDGIDNDCDGVVDDGFGVGDVCGTNVGECTTGTKVCAVGGGTECDGNVAPEPEECDGLDNDCDGTVDDGNPGGGKACGEDEGECKQGTEQCVAGQIKCVGSLSPAPEVCDCKDNDCDGEEDELNTDGSGLCAGGSECRNCQCAPPCDLDNEFSILCARGRAPVTDPKTGDCFCEAELCNEAACAGETLMVAGALQCAPGSTTVGACVCKQNTCVAPCNGVVCEGGLVCDATDGTCKAKTCLLAQFACGEGEVCDVNTGGCMADPCATTTCADNFGCRDGACIGSCAGVTCAAGQHCLDGVCQVDRCESVTCTGGDQVCDPATGGCVEAGACVASGCNDGFLCNPVSGECAADPCVRTTCPGGQICAEGQCNFRCEAPLIDCDETCIDPSKDKQHCGATADCQGPNAGSVCQGDQVCSEGQCSDSCSAGINCGGECIDPGSDNGHCGARGDCAGANAGIVCPSGASCIEGSCQITIAPTDPDQQQRVIATGGGGCACTVPVGTQSQRGTPWALLMAAMGLLFTRRRYRSWLLARGALVGALALTAMLTMSGCKVDTFCLNCQEEGTITAGTSGGGFGNAGTNGGGGVRMDSGTGGGGTGGGGTLDGSVVPGTDGSTPMTNVDGGTTPDCTDKEICNGKDDDCDGRVDEGTDAAAEGIKLDSDPNNCGACGRICTLAHAFNSCVAGECKIKECDVAFVDLDDEESNGCEYACTKDANKDDSCDNRDNDCDGEIDDEVDLDTDEEHCGGCGNTCSLAHAAGGSECVSGACALDRDQCDTGYIDVDDVDANGCEYKCTPQNGGVELCNKADDDCDTKIDEGVATTDSAIGDACGLSQGVCGEMRGTQQCVGGQVVCVGDTKPTTETCDGEDNDCDAKTDESFAQKGLPCGTDVGECVRGNRQCVSGDVTCVGRVDAVAEICDGKDNDCDGKSDEDNATDGPPEGVGEPCRTTTGGVVETNPAAAVGACQLGVAQCVSGHLDCVGEVGPQPELCDDIDQDCNGNPVNGVNATDTRIGKACGSGLGECVMPGVNVCNTTTEEIECTGGKLPVPEICNGKDDDCDGSYDETDTMTGVKPVGAGQPCKINASGNVEYGPSVTVQGECELGTSVCSGVSVACPDYVGPQPELCDGLDQDCDGTADDGVASTDPQVGQACAGSSVGACDPGTKTCSGGAIVCQGVVTASAEVCDGIDNDCDGSLADDGANEPLLGQACGTDTGACSAGVWQCSGGSMQCAGQVGPVNETCDASPANSTAAQFDGDCDGVSDYNEYQMATNVNRCGACGTVCSFTNATPKCTGGVCSIASCLPGYFDSALVAGVDCAVGPCTLAGSEICNGADDNCNGQLDEGLTPPSNACNTVGACSGATISCQGASGWVCSKLPAVESCNGADDDCDGKTDEGYNVGGACSASGVGACATPGTLACAPGGATTQCVDGMGNPVVAGTPGTVQETCNGKDDDCDTKIDEPCDGGADTNCVTDAWVTLGGGTDIYKYEASRPDATGVSSGALGSRACSVAGRLPWTNVTYAQAKAACEAADPDGRLCLESEWEQACMNDTMGTCTWGFPGHPACNTWTSTQCNGADYASTPDIQTSGNSGSSGACYRGPTNDTSKQIFEITGNVKEYVLQRATGAIPVRGGATNNTQDGMRCDFDFPVWPDNSPFVNVGFRCCRNPNPLPPICTTFSASGLSATNATLATHTIAVSGVVGNIVDVNVVGFTGTHTNMTQVDYMELVGPDGTTRRLTNQSYCTDSQDNWSFGFDQDSANTLPPTCPINGTYRPFASLDGYDGKSANGNWTIRVHDNNQTGSGVLCACCGICTASPAPTITAWGVQICVPQ